MSKIIPMPKRTTEAASSGSEYIIRYPRLQRGSVFADFMRDKRMNPKVYYCVIQREGSNEIISWTQHPSFKAAMTNAKVTPSLLLGSSLAEA